MRRGGQDELRRRSQRLSPSFTAIYHGRNETQSTLFILLSSHRIAHPWTSVGHYRNPPSDRIMLYHAVSTLTGAEIAGK